VPTDPVRVFLDLGAAITAGFGSAATDRLLDATLPPLRRRGDRTAVGSAAMDRLLEPRPWHPLDG